jgi:hypothetical protein
MTTTRTPMANRFQPIDPQPDALPMPNQTDKTLAQIRTELLTTFSAADRESYSHLVGWLRDTDVASHALKVGDTAPDFLLPDADGRLHSSEQLQRTPRPVFLPRRPLCRPRNAGAAGSGGAAGGELRMASNSTGRGACVTVAWPGEA